MGSEGARSEDRFSAHSGGAAAGSESSPEPVGGAFEAPTYEKKEVTYDQVRSLGWVPPAKYDYSVYMTDHSTRNDLVEEGKEPKWLSQAARYEWDDEYGDVGPHDEKLEDELFRSMFINRIGNKMDAYEYRVNIQGPQDVAPVRRFIDAGLHPVMLENVHNCGYDVPTPVQAYCIPAVLLGHDVVATAQTGSGKTAAYLIPILSRLMGKAGKVCGPKAGINGAQYPVRAEPIVVIVTPTRELTIQIFNECRRLCYRTKLRPCVIYGGVPARVQADDLRRGCDVLVATPGRLIDFMEKANTLSLNRCKFTVLDEADELLHTDWEPEMKKIMRGATNVQDDDHTYMMFSATFNKTCRKVAKEYMSEDRIRVTIGREGSTHKNISQQVIWTNEDQKRNALVDLLLSLPPARTLIFVNSRRTADLLDDFLYNQTFPCTSIHYDRTQLEREEALTKFRDGSTPILIATGISARGIDVCNCMHVINYDLPAADRGGIDEYIHRIGRTARIGNEGLATSFYNDKNEDIADKLVKILVENDKPVPDFLQQYTPQEGDKLDFDDESLPSSDEDEFGQSPNDNGSTAGSGVAAPEWKAPSDSDDDNANVAW
ncbi:DEAD/DEAH box RNA helicase [Lineolata rhizophorae]|uniref:RNA helicase n=1 Tax=Lineolata rhizophorae TaxID=578093 RepID=A0A6A6NL94_9PEZI|nr:DEAD/DEAH box RNA helicase [Lineolata rhizophorae]